MTVEKPKPKQLFRPITTGTNSSRAVFKWLSKVITWLRLLRFVIGLKDSRHFFNQWEAKPEPIAPCTRDFSCASGELQVIARNCDWSMELFVPVVIGRSNCFGFGFSTVNWKPLYEPVTIPSNYLYLAQSAGKSRVRGAIGSGFTYHWLKNWRESF